MCELFCLVSRLPTVATITLQRFAERGSLTSRMIDGWGLAFFDGSDVRQYREPEPAADSTWLQFIQSRRMATCLLISHIRHATRGAVSLANTQPFAREIAGRVHCFAHNGRMESVERVHASELHRYHPVGDTDSEFAACVLFERIAHLWSTRELPALADRLDVVTRFAAEMREMGPANFLYSDGITLFAHGHRRIQAGGRIAPPGLWRLHRGCDIDRDALVRGGVHLEGDERPQELTLVASVPLTDEDWQPLAEGEVMVMAIGQSVGDSR